MSKKVEDYIQEGIYGAKEIKPDERRKYLGTLRERIILALSKGQVIKQVGFSELQYEMENYPDAKLLLNGEISNHYLIKYIELASKCNIHHTTIFNQQSESMYGAILMVDHAINKEEIEIKANEKEENEEEKTSSFTKWISSLFD